MQLAIVPSKKHRAVVGETFNLDNPYEVCAFVRSAILDSGLKYNEIAQRSGVCSNTVSRMASGETKDPRIKTVVSILTTLGYRFTATKI